MPKNLGVWKKVNFGSFKIIDCPFYFIACSKLITECAHLGPESQTILLVLNILVYQHLDMNGLPDIDTPFIFT